MNDPSTQYFLFGSYLQRRLGMKPSFFLTVIKTKRFQKGQSMMKYALAQASMQHKKEYITSGIC